MARHVTIELDLPNDLWELRLPGGVHQRLQELLDRQDQGSTSPRRNGRRPGASSILPTY